MYRFLVFAICIILVSSCVDKPHSSYEMPKELNIIPNPNTVSLGNDYYTFQSSVSIQTDSENSSSVVQLLSDFLQSKGMELSEDQSNKPSIVLSIVDDPQLGTESYTLNVDKEGVKIEATTNAGHFYGFQTLLQIISEDGKNIPFVEITDSPRFAYRGLHLDVGRHMFPTDFIKKYIDLMAHHKFNRFHWHLTEDQGWRIEIKKYPKLQEIAAYRDETVVGHATTATRAQATYDGKRYGGYYTQEEIKEIVQYAKDRFVTIIPEIELPGHAQAALTAYPTLGCTGGPYSVATTWGVFDDVYCVGKEETFKFLENVFDEVLELFPSEYIHIGGDECPKKNWNECPHCKQRMETEKLKDTHELQSYFVQRIEKYLNSKGRSIIGWDEILEGGLAPNATVMSWRGEEGGIAAAKQNHDVIMTPGKWCYFDKYQDSTATEPLAIGGLTTVEKVYSYEPVPTQLNQVESKHILGAQANLWSEYITSSEYAEYMMYPRACALSEVVWSKKENRDYQDFLQRMQHHFKRLDDWDVNYAKHIQQNPK